MVARSGVWVSAAVVTGVACAVSLLTLTSYFAAIPTSMEPWCAAGGSDSPVEAPPWAMSPARESVVGDQHWYNFSSYSSQGQADLGEVGFEVQTAVGQVVTSTSSWAIVVLDETNAQVGAWNFSIQHWTMGDAVPWSNGMTVVLFTGTTNLSNLGDVFVVLAGAPCSGSMSVQIP